MITIIIILGFWECRDFASLPWLLVKCVKSALWMRVKCMPQHCFSFSFHRVCTSSLLDMNFICFFCCLTNFSYFYGILIHFVWNNLGMAWLNFIPFTVQPNSDFEGNKITMIAECRDLLCSSKLFQSTSILQISYSNFLAASIHKVQ